jgi:hypothetical protein
MEEEVYRGKFQGTDKTVNKEENWREKLDKKFYAKF